MTKLTIIMMIWFAWYPLYIKNKFGRLSSISASSYELKKPKKYILFTGWLTVLAILTILQTLYVEGFSDVLFGFMGMGFAFAGVTVDHNNNPTSGEDEYHTYGTILSIVSGFILLWVLLPILTAFVLTAIMIFGTASFAIGSKKWKWYAEWLSMFIISSGLIIHSLI